MNDWATLSNNTGLFNSTYTSLGDGSVDNLIAYGARHALANSPEMNAADMQTKGYEISLNWCDQLQLASRPFSYNVGLVLSDYKSTITKYDNPNKTFAKQYYEGMELGEIWGFVTDGFVGRGYAGVPLC